MKGDLVHRLANTLAFERRCRGPVPGRVSSRDKGDPRRGGQAQERARRRTLSTPYKRATSTPDVARGSLVAAEKASLATGACGSVCTASPLSDSLRPARRTVSTPTPCSVILRGLTAHPLRLGCRSFRGQAPRPSFVALLHHTQRYASVARLAGAAHRRSRCVKLFTRRYTRRPRTGGFFINPLRFFRWNRCRASPPPSRSA